MLSTSTASTNLDYWSGKIGRNQARDLETTSLLEERGWRVLRFWEHEAADSVAGQVVEVVRERRQG